MGLDNRDYAREEERGFQLRAPQTMIGTLILINVAINLLDIFSEGKIGETFGLTAQVFHKPWYFWQVLTYGFMHSTGDILHVVFNMFGLWIFGREIEQLYGKREFLWIYLAAITVGGLAWLGVQMLPSASPARLVGASGAVTCITVLFALHYPSRIILIFGILPVAAWILCTIFVLQDIAGALGNRYNVGDNTAYIAHLGGAAFAFAYYRFGWNFSRALPDRFELPSFKRIFNRGPKLKLHDPATEPPPPSLDAEVDRILAKINATKFESLTEEERRTLERASARYQKRRQ